MNAPEFTAEQAAELQKIVDGDPEANGKAAKKFVPRHLADELASETPVASAASGQLYVYRRGAYRPDGERDLRGRIAQKLGDEWKRNREAEVLGFLSASAPRLWAEPPRDRINCRNGILDLDTGKLGPHDPGFLSPVQIGAAFDPEATCSAIEKFLGEVLAPDLVPVVCELAGYLVTPDNSLQTAVMMLGEGSNGKSTLLEVLTALVGRENVANVALHRLDEDKFSAAALEGKLANVFADLDARALQASSMFKQVTGGDRVEAERKYAHPFSFYPYARLLYSANQAPPTPDSSDAFFRRWLILPFDRRIDAGGADRSLAAKLTTPGELSGLLNLGLARLPELRERGAFAEAESATAAQERFRVDSDSVSGFVAECVVEDMDSRTARPAMFDAYRNWCGENNRRPLSRQRFNSRIEILRPAAAKLVVRGTDYWSGLGLRGQP